MWKVTTRDYKNKVKIIKEEKKFSKIIKIRKLTNFN
jgi:hypothetical protein